MSLLNVLSPTGNKCSAFLFFFRLKMDRDISYILFLLLIVSGTMITTLGSAIKAKNLNGEVNSTESTYVIACLRNLLFPK